MSKQTGRKALIILSDGGDRNSKETLVKSIEAAQRADTIIYAIYFKGEEPHQNYPQRGGRGGGYPGGGYPGGGYPGGRRVIPGAATPAVETVAATTEEPIPPKVMSTAKKSLSVWPRRPAAVSSR